MINNENVIEIVNNNHEISVRKYQGNLMYPVEISFDKRDIEHVISTLQEILNDTDKKCNDFIVGDSITVLKGQFSGMTGRVIATEKELIILMDKTDINDEFYAYIDKDNVE